MQGDNTPGQGQIPEPNKKRTKRNKTSLNKANLKKFFTKKRLIILGVAVIVIVVAVIAYKIVNNNHIQSKIDEMPFKTCGKIYSAIDDGKYDRKTGIRMMERLAEESDDKETKMTCYSLLRDSYYLYMDDSDKNKDLNKALKYGLLAEKYTNDEDEDSGNNANALYEIYSQMGKNEDAKKYHDIAEERGYFDDDDEEDD